jgi:hypothetical protein
MTAVLAEIELERNIFGLKCPVTGVTVLPAMAPFQPTAEQSPHLRFVIDSDEVWVADPSDLRADHAKTQARVCEILASAPGEDRLDDLLQECISILSPSVLVLRIITQQDGPRPSEAFTACFDLANPANLPWIRLRAGG